MLLKLKEYEKEHKQLDELLNDEKYISSLDQLSIQRMKKRKLWLKDQIAVIKSQLYPDIIA